MGYNSLALLQTLLRSKLLLEKTAMQTFTCSRRQDFHNYGDSFTEDLAGIGHPKIKFFKYFKIWSKTPLDHNEFYSMGMLTPTNNHMTRCLWTVTNSLQLSCTLFMLCGGKQRPCQSLFGRQRQIFSVCVGGDGCQTPAQIRGEKRSVWKQNRDSSNAGTDEQSTSTTPASDSTAAWCQLMPN